MRITSFVALALATAASVSTVAEARPHPHGFGGGDFEANKKFGLGLELGEPTGLNGKLFVTPNQALDFGIGSLGYAYRYYGDTAGIHLYLDYLWHPVTLAKTEAFELPFYVGIGGRFWEFGYACDARGNNCVDASGIGARVPVGISFDFNNVPLDIFIQLVPTLDFFHNYTNHDVGLDVDFSVGIRYWFS